jgi:dTDP-glucose 4,6-dehydratase
MKKIKILLILIIFHINSECHLYSDGVQKKVTRKPSEKTVLLTGAAGFIGSNFLKYMFDKYPSYNFIVLDALTYAGNMNNIPKYIKDSPRFAFWYGSVTNYSLVEQLTAQAHFIVHFAAESHVTRSLFDNKSFIDTDVMGTQIMMDALVKHKNVERFIHISTSEVYGTAQTEPMAECHPLNPRSPYAAAKVGADRLVYSYCCAYDVPAVIIRPFNNFGPNQHPEKVIPRFITSLLKDEPLTIHGDGTAKRDWVYVLDVCRGLDLVLHHENFDAIKHQVINFGSGTAISVIEIAKMLLEYFELPDSYLKFIGDRPGQVQTHIAATQKAENLLGWKVEKSLKDTLGEVIEWYRSNETWWENSEFIKLVPINTGNNKLEMH